MKKLLCLTLLVGLVAAMGCSSSTDTGPKASPPPYPRATPEKKG